MLILTGWCAGLGFGCQEDSPSADVDRDEVQTPEFELSIELSVRVLDGGDVYLGDRLVGSDECSLVVTTDDCRPLATYPLLTDDDFEAFAETFDVPGTFVPVCTADPTPRWQGLERQQFVWRRTDGSLDSFLLLAAQDPESKAMAGFILRARQGDIVTLSAGKLGWCEPATRDADGVVRVVDASCQLLLGSESYGDTILEDHEAKSWWMHRFEQGASMLQERDD